MLAARRAVTVMALTGVPPLGVRVRGLLWPRPANRPGRSGSQSDYSGVVAVRPIAVVQAWQLTCCEADSRHRPGRVDLDPGGPVNVDLSFCARPAQRVHTFEPT